MTNPLSNSIMWTQKTWNKIGWFIVTLGWIFFLTCVFLSGCIPIGLWYAATHDTQAEAEQSDCERQVRETCPVVSCDGTLSTLSCHREEHP